MKVFAIVFLCAALCLSGCDQGSGGLEMDSRAEAALTGVLIAAAVGVGTVANSIYRHQHRNIERYQPGLNLSPDTKLVAGKAFRVRAIVADEKGKAIKAEWDNKTVEWSIVPAAGDSASVSPTKTERQAGAMAAEFKLEAPGAYRVTFKEWAKDADTKTATPLREGTVDIQVR